MNRAPATAAAILASLLLVIATTAFLSSHTNQGHASDAPASNLWSWPWSSSAKDEPGCVQGVCQVTTVSEVIAGVKMNIGGPARWFWDSADSTGMFNYAGDTTAYVSFAQVKKVMQAMPEEFHEGTVFKPNDLGLLRLNGEIFTYAANPAIALGAPRDMHAVFRPILMEMFANESEWNVDTFTNEAHEFIDGCKKKGELTQTDISTWTQQMLHKYGLQKDISQDEAAKFQKYALGALANSILPQAVFGGITGGLTKSKLKTSDLRAQNAKYITEYAGAAKARCPLRGLSDNDAGMVSHALVDGALSFAGGISVPGIITSMLGVLYGGKHGDFSKQYTTPAFLWETVRFYPAVVGVPFVKTGTTQREDALIPGALSDTAVWGDDAFDFKLRDESLYQANLDVAWSGFTTSTKYPNDSHSCPGMAMSKALMLGFMKALDKDDWTASTPPKQVTKAPVAWNGFSLVLKK